MNQANPVTKAAKSSLRVVKLKSIVGMLALTTKGGVVEFVNEEDIVYCKAEGGNTLFYFQNGDCLSSPRLLKTALDSLSENFYRIHHSYIVNMNYAKKFIKKNSGGNLEMFDGSILPVSQKNRTEVLGLFKTL